MGYNICPAQSIPDLNSCIDLASRCDATAIRCPDDGVYAIGMSPVGVERCPQWRRSGRRGGGWKSRWWSVSRGGSCLRRAKWRRTPGYTCSHQPDQTSQHDPPREAVPCIHYSITGDGVPLVLTVLVVHSNTSSILSTEVYHRILQGSCHITYTSL